MQREIEIQVEIQLSELTDMVVIAETAQQLQHRQIHTSGGTTGQRVRGEPGFLYVH